MSPLARPASLALALLGALLSTGCSARRSEPVVGPKAFNAAETRGQIVFMHQCNNCHPQGEAGLGPGLNNKPLPAAAIKAQVRAGLGAMPPFPQDRISDPDLDDLVAYLIAVRNAK